MTKRGFEKTYNCLCDDQNCAKCLSSNCTDDDCRVHKLFQKAKRRLYEFEDLKAIKAKFKKLEESGVSKEELSKLHDYKRLSKIAPLKKELDRLNGLVTKGYARRIS